MLEHYLKEARWAVATLSVFLFVATAIYSERRLLVADVELLEKYLVASHVLSLKTNDVRLGSGDPSGELVVDPSIWKMVLEKAGNRNLLTWLGPEMATGRLSLSEATFITDVPSVGEVYLRVSNSSYSQRDWIFGEGGSDQTQPAEGLNLAVHVTSVGMTSRRQLLSDSIAFYVSDRVVTWSEGFFLPTSGDLRIFLGRGHWAESGLTRRELESGIVAIALRWGVTAEDLSQALFLLRSRYESQRVRLPLVQTEVVASYSVAILAGLAVGASAWLSLVLLQVSKAEPRQLLNQWTLLSMVVQRRNSGRATRAAYAVHFLIIGFFYLGALIAPLAITCLAWLDRPRGAWLISSGLLACFALGTVFSASVLVKCVSILTQSFELERQERNY